MRRARREIKRLKTYLGRVFRDVRRKLEARSDLAERFARPLALVEWLPAHQRHDKNKLYALHAPEVACIAKGKAHKKYEFGAKVAVAVTNREGLVVGMQTYSGKPRELVLGPAKGPTRGTAGPWPRRWRRSRASPARPPSAATSTAAIAATG
jgi:hypothetical protein